MLLTKETDKVQNLNFIDVKSSNSCLKGEFQCPPDKSISHRAAMISAMAEGRSSIENYLMSQDPFSTLECLGSLGVKIDISDGVVNLESKGLKAFSEPEDVLDCGNSGTTARLISGILSSMPFSTFITGDKSLRRRPMKRIFKPLSEMGAVIRSRSHERLPALIHGGQLKALSWNSQIASAQVKTAILFAGLSAEGITSVTEPALSRDHTERMLHAAGVEVIREGLKVSVMGGQVPQARKWKVPGDPSSAAFIAAAALLRPGSEVIIRNVCLNETRIAFYKVLKRMGAFVSFDNIANQDGDVIGDIIVRHSSLKGTTVEGPEIPALIDEIPVLALLACRAEGKTVIRDAGDLRNKESDRISALAKGLNSMGARIEERPDGMVIFAGEELSGSELDPEGDHRLAMTFALAGMIASGITRVVDFECVNVSFPGFRTTVLEAVQK